MKTKPVKKQTVKSAIIFVLLMAMLVNLTSCYSADTSDVSAGNSSNTVSREPTARMCNLSADISPNTVSGKKASDSFVNSTANFSIELFKKSITDKENSLVSPLSVLLALSMTANGADNETLSQMEKILGNNISIDDLNEYLFKYVKNLPSDDKSKLSIANSIWFCDNENRLTVEKNFLQKNADYYNAAAYMCPFDDQTLKDINDWVKTNTDGLIDKILEEIDPDTVMYLINAIVFDAEWQNVYSTEDISEGTFTAIDGSKQTAEFMHSNESEYLNDGNATGFIKPYFNDNYSFVALLPNEDISIEDYIQTLSGKGFLKTIKTAESASVNATLPKFSYAYTIKMNDALIDLGMPDAFSGDIADFSKLGKSAGGNIYIGEVLHKTFISVDELGTKAGAVTKVEMQCKGMIQDIKVVTLDRPFVYAIIDNSTNLPVFIGTVMSIN